MTVHDSSKYPPQISSDEVFQPRSRRVEPSVFASSSPVLDADVTGSRDLFRIIVATQRSPPER